MKQILLAMVISGTAQAVMAQEKVDTVLYVENPASVVITENPGGFDVTVISDTTPEANRMVYTDKFDKPVTVKAKKWRSAITLPFDKNRSSDWDFTLGGPGIGWVNACGQPDGMGVELGKSLEISWLNMFAVKYRMPWKSSRLSIGFGLDWRNYRISTSDARFVPSGDGGVALAPYPEEATAKGSRLKVFSMGIPVIWQQHLPFKLFGNKFLVGAGAVFNYNSHASLKTKWVTADGDRAEQKTNHIGHRRFTVDFIGLVRIWRGVNVYVRYSPNSVLRGAGQPKFNPLSSGIILYY